jgi:thioredoxin 2
MVSPVVERMAEEYAGRLKAVKLDVDGAPEISARFAVQGIPLLVLMRDGGELARLTGAAPLPRLQSWLNSQLTLAAAG